jgi:hypothetical protein
MEIRRGDLLPKLAARATVPLSTVFYLLCSVFLLYGCAAPAEPVERKPPTPAAITDLAASQIGNDVTLTFTLPRDSVEKRQLQQTPTIEIYRDFAPVTSVSASALGAPHPHPSLLLTIPPAMVDQYSAQGRVRIVNSLTAEDFTQHPASDAFYMARTFVSPKKRSADSNIVPLAINPAPDPIADLKAEITPSGVELSWTPPQSTLVGLAPPIGSYRVYRAEIDVSATPVVSTATGAGTPKLKSPFARIADPASPPYTDTQVELGKTYAYAVRSLAEYPVQDPDKKLESLDSNSVTVTPKDIFPPSAPQNIVVVFVPAATGRPAHLELSWAINPETDIAGYNIYRSEEQNTSGTRVNTELLLTPAFRDMNVVAGRGYFYSVTAVDRSGNESPASSLAFGIVPAETQSQKDPSTE